MVTENPTASPTASPTGIPTSTPTTFPTRAPTAIPTAHPTNNPTSAPTTASPSRMVTENPTAIPTSAPSVTPTVAPSISPTTVAPTESPTTLSPTRTPPSPSPPPSAPAPPLRKTQGPAPPPPPVISLLVGDLEYEEYEPEPVVDLVAPILSLIGDQLLEVQQRAVYTDPGAEAIDAVDGYVAVNTVGLDAVDTSLPTEVPFVIMYSAQDSSGNQADVISRKVVVVDPCITPEQPDSFLCPLPSDACASCMNGVCLCLDGNDEAAVEVVEYVVVPDTTPPVLQLNLGDGQWAKTSSGDVIAVHTYFQYSSAFVDPGAIAVDDIDGNLTTSISRFGLGSVDMTKATPDDSPYVISYTVRDSAGNLAKKRRRVYVTNPCAPEIVCESEESEESAEESEELVCSVEQLCNSVSFAEEEPIVPTPPTLVLTGPSVVYIEQNMLYTKCSSEASMSATCDRGATATDTLDGDITDRLLACSPDGVKNRFDSRGVRGCDLDTKTPGTYHINFTAINSAGLQSEPVVRTVIVKVTCPAGEVPCSNQVECSEGGFCSDDLAVVASDEEQNYQPTITLNITKLLPSVVSVKQYDTYEACAPGSYPEEGALCELGASAFDSQNANLTARVLSCPPKSCFASGKDCDGHEFSKKGIQGCITTSAAVGSLLTIRYIVFDDAGNNATVDRSISIVAPCPAGQYYCLDDASCSILECAERDALFPAETVDQIPPEFVYTEGRQTTLTFRYGDTAAFSLVPCATASDTSGCWVSATDEVDGDVSAFITIEQDTAGCPDCPMCSVQMLSIGACFPAVYTYIYRVADTAGNEAIDFVVVNVVQQGEVKTEIEMEFGGNQTAAFVMANRLRNTSSVESLAFRSGVAQMLNAGSSTPGKQVTPADVNITAVTPLKRGATFYANVEITITTSVGSTGSAALRRQTRRLQQQTINSSGVDNRNNDVKNLLESSANTGDLSTFLSSAAQLLNGSSFGSVSELDVLNVAQTTQALDVDQAYLSSVQSAIASLQDSTKQLTQKVLALNGAQLNSLGNAGSWLRSHIDVWNTYQTQEKDRTKGILVDIQEMFAKYDELATAYNALDEVNRDAQEGMLSLSTAKAELVNALISSSLTPNALPFSTPPAPNPPGPAECAALPQEASKNMFFFDPAEIANRPSPPPPNAPRMPVPPRVAAASVFSSILFSSVDISNLDNADYASSFRLNFTAAMANAAGVSATDVVIQSIVAGSTIVNSTTFFSTGGNGRPKTFANVLQLNPASVFAGYIASTDIVAVFTLLTQDPSMNQGDSDYTANGWLESDQENGSADWDENDSDSASDGGRRHFLYNRRALLAKRGGANTDGDTSGSVDNDDSGSVSYCGQTFIPVEDLGTKYRRYPRFIARKNRVVGGLILTASHKHLSRGCSARFNRLRAPCHTERDFTDPYGTDKVVTPGTELFDPDVAVNTHQYYNFTSEYDATDSNGSPRPFYAVENIGLDGKYPVVINGNIIGGRARQLVAFLREGMFFKSTWSQIEMQIHTWNSETNIMATSVVIFEKGKGGTIRGTLDTQTVLMPDSGWDAGEWRAREVIIILLIVGGISMLAFDLRSVYNVAKDEAGWMVGFQAEPMLYLYACCSLVQVITSVFYLIVMAEDDKITVEKEYNIYDDLYASANFFLPARKEVEGDADPSDMRGKLPADLSGYARYVADSQALVAQATRVRAYMVIQGVNAFMLLARVMNSLKFNKKLNMVNETIAIAISDLVHFFMVFAWITGASAISGLVAFGDRYEMYSSFNDAMLSSFIWGFSGDFSGPASLLIGRGQYHTETPLAQFAASFYVTVQVIIMFFVLNNFLLAIICDAITAAKEASKDSKSLEDSADLQNWLMELSDVVGGRRRRRKAMVRTMLRKYIEPFLDIDDHDDQQQAIKSLLSALYGRASQMRSMRDTHPDVMAYQILENTATDGRHYILNPTLNRNSTMDDVKNWVNSKYCRWMLHSEHLGPEPLVSTDHMRGHMCTFYEKVITPNEDFHKAVAAKDEEGANFGVLKRELANPQFDIEELEFSLQAYNASRWRVSNKQSIDEVFTNSAAALARGLPDICKRELEAARAELREKEEAEEARIAEMGEQKAKREAKRKQKRQMVKELVKITTHAVQDTHQKLEAMNRKHMHVFTMAMSMMKAQDTVRPTSPDTRGAHGPQLSDEPSRHFNPVYEDEGSEYGTPEHLMYMQNNPYFGDDSAL